MKSKHIHVPPPPQQQANAEKTVLDGKSSQLRQDMVNALAGKQAAESELSNYRTQAEAEKQEIRGYARLGVNFSVLSQFVNEWKAHCVPYPCIQQILHFMDAVQCALFS